MVEQKLEKKDFLELSKVFFQNTEVETQIILHVYEDLFEEAKTDKCYLGVVDDLKERLEALVDSLSDISKQIPEIRQRFLLLVSYYDSKDDEKMTVLEIFKKYDFESVLPHLNHLFEVNSKHSMSAEFIEVCRGIYNHWANECETKPTDCYIRLVSRWEYTSPSIDMNCHVKEKNVFCYAVADQKDMIEVLGMKVRVDKDVEISEVELAAGLFWEMTYHDPRGKG